MPRPPALQSIDPTALSKVSGGASRTPSSSSTDTGSADAAVVTALTGILDSLHDLASSRNSGGGFNTQDLVLVMMMMQQRNRQQVTVVQPATTWPFPPAIR